MAATAIAFGAAMILSSNSVGHLYRAKQALHRLDATRTHAVGEILAGEMASGSTALRCLTSLAAIVLGVLAVTKTDPVVLTLVGLLVLGATVLLTGSVLQARRPGPDRRQDR